MAETRAERLSRIRATADQVVSQKRMFGTPRAVALLPDDVLWLLSQVSDTLEYRAEGYEELNGQWVPLVRYGGQTPPVFGSFEEADALRAEAEGLATRVTYRPAPVQVWTPVEDGQT